VKCANTELILLKKSQNSAKNVCEMLNAKGATLSMLKKDFGDLTSILKVFTNVLRKVLVWEDMKMKPFIQSNVLKDIMELCVILVTKH